MGKNWKSVCGWFWCHLPTVTTLRRALHNWESLFWVLWALTTWTHPYNSPQTRKQRIATSSNPLVSASSHYMSREWTLIWLLSSQINFPCFWALHKRAFTIHSLGTDFFCFWKTHLVFCVSGCRLFIFIAPCYSLIWMHHHLPSNSIFHMRLGS